MTFMAHSAFNEACMKALARCHRQLTGKALYAQLSPFERDAAILGIPVVTSRLVPRDRVFLVSLPPTDEPRKIEPAKCGMITNLDIDGWEAGYDDWHSDWRQPWYVRALRKLSELADDLADHLQDSPWR